MVDGLPAEVDDDAAAVGVSTDGNVGIMLPDGRDPYEVGPVTARALGHALLAAAEYADAVRFQIARRN